MGNCISGNARSLRSNLPQRGQEPDIQPISASARKQASIPALPPPPGRPASGPGRLQWDKIGRKLEPYISKSSLGFENLNLNLQVSVLGEHEDASASEQTVACRHFAAAFAQHAGKKQGLFKTFGAQESIRTHFNGNLRQIDLDLYEIYRSAPAGSKHLVLDKQLGHYLSALARALPAPALNQASECNCLLVTLDHMMALHVQRKCKEGVDYFSAKLYDPNATAACKRVEARTALAFANISLEELMVVPAARSSYGLSPDRGLRMMAICLEGHLPLDTGRRTLDPTDVNMHFAIRFGSTDDMDAICLALDAKKNSLGSDALFKILRACGIEGGAPGMYFALQDGVLSTVHAFAHVVRKSGLSDGQKFELLAAKNAESAPGLFMAMQAGHAEAVQMFGSVVLDSELADDLKFELLAAKDAKSTPAMFMAMQNGNAEAIEKFGSVVLGAGLTDDQKFELLAAKSAPSCPGMFIAMQQGNAAAVQAFGSMVRNSGLTDDQKFELLAAKSARLVPGMFRAMRHGHAEVIQTFGSVVLGSGLTDDQKFELLAAKSAQSCPGMFMAMQQGNAAAVQAFGSIVRNSGLTDDQRFELLAAKSAQSCPGMFIAMQQGNAAAVQAFGSMVRNSGLTDDQKFELLAANHANRLTGLRSAMENGHQQAVDAFTQVTLDSGLRADKVHELLNPE